MYNIINSGAGRLQFGFSGRFFLEIYGGISDGSEVLYIDKGRKTKMSDTIRNVAIIGHSGEGKTTLTEAILFNAGVIDRQGRVDDGNTVSDYDPEEIARKISISRSGARCANTGRIGRHAIC